MRYKAIENSHICPPDPHGCPTPPHHAVTQENFCHKNQCSDNKKHGNKTGLLTEFDFDEFNQNQDPFPSNLISLAKTALCIEDKCDKVLLNAAINWQPPETITATLNLTERDTIGFRRNIRVRFTIWRGNPSNPSFNAIPICTFVDASPEVLSFIETIDIDPTTEGFQPGLSITTAFIPVTTDFKCVDENPICGKTEYFLTMDVIDFVGAPFSATAVTFTAMKIKKNDDNCC